MKKTLLMLILAALSCSASTLYTLGYEDWSGPGSDRDFNDTVIQISGVHFNLGDAWTRPTNPQYPLETPFPYATANYFTDAIADGGPITATLLFHQTAATEFGYFADGPWTQINGTATINALAGDVIHFELIVNGADTLYPDASLNPDGLSHAIVASEQVETPEPAAYWLIGSGLLIVALRRRNGHHAE